jgi:hypothetical protein
MSGQLTRIVVVLFLIVSFAPAASSDTFIRVQLGEVVDACRSDAARLCRGVVPGGGRIAACLVAQMPALSHECHNALAITAALRSCEIDYHRFCRGVPGGAPAFHCLAGYAAELSAPCNSALRANVPGYRGY